MNNSGKSFHKFMLLWSGELISAIGSGLTAFGLEIYVFQQTGKASATALVALLAFMPGILMAVFAGVLADRYDRRIMMILGDSLSAVGVLFILICMFRGEAQLWQICVGVTISSLFSSLMEPSYKATITDLLTEEEYTKASGLVQIAGSARFLIAPALAGLLLAVSDIKLLLMIDISTFLVTVTSTLVVRSGITSKKYEQAKSLIYELKEGWKAVSDNRGILALIMMGSLITFSLGFIQVLAVPMILAFSTKSVAGMLESAVAMGMLVSSILLGFLPVRKGYVRMPYQY